MKKRIGNDITFTWHIYRKSGDTQVPESFTGKDVEVKLISPLQRPVTIEDVSIATGVVTFTFRGKHQVTLGNYVAVLQENKGADGMVTLDVVDAVTLVPHSYMEEGGDDGDVIEAEAVELESSISAGGGGGIEQQQADWAQTDDTAVDYIKNKPDLGGYVRKVSETEQTIHSDIEVDGVFESHDQYERKGIGSWTHQIETNRSQGEITISNINYENGDAQTCREINIYGYRTGHNPGSGLSVISYYILSSGRLPYAEIEIREDVYLRKRNNDGTYTEHYLSQKQNVIDDLQTIREGAAAGATAIQPADLATVAISGSYNDLSDKPEIGGTAASVSYDNARTGLSATNVQDAIDEMADTNLYETVVLTVGSADSSFNPVGQTITVTLEDGSATQYTVPMSRQITFIVQRGMRYNISGTSTDDYRVLPISVKAAIPTRYLTMRYIPVATGVFILQSDGNYYLRQEYDAETMAEDAVGVLVLTSALINAGFGIVIGKNDTNLSLSVPQSSITLSTTNYTEYVGKTNTQEINSMYPTQFPPVNNSAEYTMICNGAVLVGYCASIAEGNLLVSNKSEINLALALIGAAELPHESQAWTSSYIYFNYKRALKTWSNGVKVYESGVQSGILRCLYQFPLT